MFKRLAFLTLTASLALSACADDDANKKTINNSNETPLTKTEAQQKMESDPNAPDYCDSNKWYGDGVCDTFCRKEDTPDCDTSKVECDDSTPCPSGSSCQRPAGQCSASGTCVDTTTIDCDKALAEVCGCDGKTYGNACAALVQNVSVASQGACAADSCKDEDCGPMPGLPNFLCDDGVTMAGPTGRCLKNDQSMCAWEVLECPTDTSNVCGGIQGATCQDKEYCDLGFGQCGVSDAQGKCRAVPETCPTDEDPVCGCDGKTYSNSCNAAQAGTSIDSDGACVQQTVACNAKNGDSDCESNEYCQLPPKSSCGDPDPTGVCKAKPQICSKELNYVCGCDGKTYTNACMAAAAGASIASAGQCKSDGASCGGISGTKCGGQNEYCSKPEGQCDPRKEGTCKTKPQICNKLLSYVCGCDGKTYDNACLASAVGVNVASSGKCVSKTGCQKDVECGNNQFCKFPTGTCTNRAKTGTCTNIPGLCNRLYAPVCGCDGKTYSNACNADSASESLASTKACIK